MVKKPKNRSILVAPNRNHNKNKKIKPFISNNNKKKKYKFGKKKSLITNIKNFITRIIRSILNFIFQLLFWIIIRVSVVLFLILGS